jgi:sugar phosphate isomerase/epimerase
VWRVCLGLNGFTSAERVYGLRFELSDILRHAKDLGYDGIELFLFREPYPDTVAGQRGLRVVPEPRTRYPSAPVRDARTCGKS